MDYENGLPDLGLTVFAGCFGVQKVLENPQKVTDGSL